MIAQVEYRERNSYPAERPALRELQGEPAGDFDTDDYDDEAAEICRMIELSGMIGLECSVLQGD